VLEIPLPGHRPDRQSFVVAGDAGKPFHPVQVDQGRGAGETKVHERYEALAAGQRPGIGP
jgi:hypothetical protein